MQAVLKLAFVIFSGHTKPTFWSSVTYAPPDWEQGSLDQARPWPPWAMQTHVQAGSLFISSPRAGDIEY